MKKPHIIDLQTIDQGEEGFLTVAEAGKQLPFEVKRAYWIYGAHSENVVRGEQANQLTEHILVPLQGTCVVDLENLEGEALSFSLDSPKQGVFVPSKTWRKVSCSKDCIILSLASRTYDSDDVIRDYEQWKALS